MENLTKEATTHTEMKPFDKKDWRNTEKIEVVFSIETDTEKRVFKGLIDLTGIIKK